MAYVKIIYQNSPSTATPMNAQNLNHMDDQIALNDQRLTEIETSYVKSFKGRTEDVVPEKGDYDISQIDAADGQNGYVPVWRNDGTEQSPDWKFKMEPQSGSGTGGHTIVDQDGTSMATENGLQFADSFVSDDSVNGRTVVENIKEHTTASDYENATEDGIHVIDDGNDVPIGEIEEDYEEVTGDGSKTYRQLLNELFTKINASNITNNSCIILKSTSAESKLDLAYKYEDNSTFAFTNISTSSGNTSSATMIVKSSGSDYIASLVDKSTDQVPSGWKIILYYGTSSTVINLKTDANYCQYDSETTVKDKLTKRKPTITPASGFTITNSLVEFNGVLMGKIYILGSSAFTPNTWTTVGTIDRKYSTTDDVQAIAEAPSTGYFNGVICIPANTNQIRVYPATNSVNTECTFVFPFE